MHNHYMHMDRESLAEKSLSQSFPASNVGVGWYKFKHGHLVLGSCAGSNERR